MICFWHARAALRAVVPAVFAGMIPGLGWIAATLAALGILTIIGGWALGLVDSGDPTDVNPNVGEFHTNMIPRCRHRAPFHWK
jgi:hypothetical protein